MLIGIISDIHSNLMALQSVLDALNDHAIDELWCTGDLVGYYTFPEECLQKLMMEHNPFMIKGNHDQSVATGIIPDYISYNAATSVFWTSQQLNKEYRRLLYSLPTMIRLTRSQKRILLLHGGFEYPLDEYLSTDPNDLVHGISRYRFSLSRPYSYSIYLYFSQQNNSYIRKCRTA